MSTKLDRNLKGQSGTVLLVAVLMGVLLSGFVAIALIQQLPDLFSSKVNDAGPITEIEARADYLTNGYIDQSARFSYYEAALIVGEYDKVSTYGPYPNIPVKYGTAGDGYSGSGAASIDRFYQVYFNWIETIGGNELQQYVDDLDSAATRCNIRHPSSYDLSVFRKEPRIKVETTSDEPLIKSVACNKPGTLTNYSVNKQRVKLDTQNSHLHNMAIATSDALGGMWNKSEDIDSGSDSGQVTEASACFKDGNAGSAKSDAKDAAESQAYDEIEDEVKDIEKRGQQEMKDINSGNVGIPFINAIMDFVKKGFDQAFPNQGNDKGVSLYNNETDVSLDSSQKVECDSDPAKCEDWSCESGFDDDPDFDGDDKPLCKIEPGESITYDCDSGTLIPGDVDNCYNSTSLPRRDIGVDADCEPYEGYSTSRVPGTTTCQLDNRPAPDCDNWQERWEATYDYQLEKVTFNTSVLDESQVPTSAGANDRLPLQRVFIYDFN